MKYMKPPFFRSMIVIITETSDGIINEVLNLFKKNQTKFILITELDDINVQIIKNGKCSLIVNKIEMDMTEVSCIWLRKISFLIKKANSEFQKYEIEYLLDYFDSLYSRIFKLNGLRHRNFNKNIYLKMADDMGIKTPKVSYICKKEDLILLSNEYPVINKPISQIPSPDKGTLMFTKYLSKEIINGLPDVFFPSLIQEYIPSILELRVVFITEKLFAIGCTNRRVNDENVDSRNRNHNYRSYFRYVLPNKITDLLLVFLKKAELKFCTMDILISKENEYFLIDINPFGNYGTVRNYYKSDIDNALFNTLIT